MMWFVKLIRRVIKWLNKKTAEIPVKAFREREVPAGRYWGPFWENHDGLD